MKKIAHGNLSRQKQMQPGCLKKLLHASELNYQVLLDEYETLRKELSCTKRILNECEAEIRKLHAENEMERFIKNSTFRFLISEGYGFNYRANLWQRKSKDKLSAPIRANAGKEKEPKRNL